jgi:integrase/recombinase XerD
MEEQEIQLYHQKDGYIRLKERIKNNSELSETNKQFILNFGKYCISKGITIHRAHKYTQQLQTIANKINKDLDKVIRKDIETFIEWLDTATYQRYVPKPKKKKYQDISYSESTKSDYRITLKVFYKWLEATKLNISVKELELQRKEPDLITFFTSRTKKDKQKMPEELLTENEVLLLIKNCLNDRDKAFISTLFESACRIGEITTLQIKNIVFDEYGCKILVNGKTGERQIRLISSAPYLKKWLNKHPLSDERNAPVWIDFQTKKLPTYNMFRKILSRAAKRSEIKKPINPHHFRHSAATILAGKLTEQQLKAYGGWKPNSDMVSVYVHLSGRDIDDAILELHGLKKKTKEDKSKMLPKKCQKCNTINDSINIYCEKCGAPLTLAAAIQTDYNKELTIRTMEEKMKILEEKFDKLSLK